MASNTDVVAKLKTEGNALFVNKQYNEAIAKYSQAIERDPSNAILFANRAACYQGMKRFGKAAAGSARQKLMRSRCGRLLASGDQTYPKGWARLATAQTALSQNVNALASWRRALAALPNDIPSPGDLVQREQYEVSMRALEERMREPSHPFTPIANSDSSPGVVKLSLPDGGAPWQKAELLEPGLEAQGIVRSSVFTILDAYESFMLGQKQMSELKHVKTRANMIKYDGHPGAIENLSNAVLTDSLHFELSSRKAPDASQPIESYVAEARRLKAEGGWNAVRPALSVSVRSAIVTAFIQSEALHNDVQAVIVLDKLLDILRWGRAEWPNASADERGSIFKDTFIRGVRTMRLNRYMRAIQSVGNRDAKYRFSFDHVMEEADALLEDLRRPQDQECRKYKGVSIAFFDIPEAMALIAKGFCFMQGSIILLSSKDDNKAEGLFKLRQAHEFYSQGADKYPPDDERCLYFLIISLIALFRSEAPLEETLPHITHIREARDAAKAIWEFIPSFKKSSDLVDELIEFEKEMLQEIAAGQITMKDSRCPSWASTAAAEHSQI
ncbi:hypothetical protein EVG20_g6395 [Dentipellis fragilis]|uniref:TPR-like protein n=1 Tax=Dentipellis fragilis TaxID=205917 RepID=A0A4Y9YNH5_9AGAM|nr:hypothetical protein EVG20_g6395 [Dentipellis fragilis]